MDNVIYHQKLKIRLIYEISVLYLFIWSHICAQVYLVIWANYRQVLLIQSLTINKEKHYFTKHK